MSSFDATGPVSDWNGGNQSPLPTHSVAPSSSRPVATTTAHTNNAPESAPISSGKPHIPPLFGPKESSSLPRQTPDANDKLLEVLQRLGSPVPHDSRMFTKLTPRSLRHVRQSTPELVPGIHGLSMETKHCATCGKSSDNLQNGIIRDPMSGTLRRVVMSVAASDNNMTDPLELGRLSPTAPDAIVRRAHMMSRGKVNTPPQQRRRTPPLSPSPLSILPDSTPTDPPAPSPLHADSSSQRWKQQNEDDELEAEVFRIASSQNKNTNNMSEYPHSTQSTAVNVDVAESMVAQEADHDTT